MKTTLKILPLLFGVMLFFTQCEKEAELEQTVNAEAFMNLKAGHELDSYCNSTSQKLWAGAGRNNTDNGVHVGYVHADIYIDSDNDDELTLKVEYELFEPWVGQEYHLWVGNAIADIPRNAAPGRFPFTGEVNIIVLSDLDIDANDNIYIAAHAVVAKSYADYDALDLPEEVSFSVYPADNVYLNVNITDEGILYGSNDGWCINPTLPIGPGVAPQPYLADVYLSTGDLPEYYQSFDFGKINWILNFAAPLVPEVYSMGDVQTAIWRVFYGEVYEVEGTEPDYTENNVLEILANADPDFLPGCNQLVGVILDTQSKEVNGLVQDLQPLLIPVPVPCQYVGEETAWAFGQHTFIDESVANKWGWIFRMEYCE